MSIKRNLTLYLVVPLLLTAFAGCSSLRDFVPFTGPNRSMKMLTRSEVSNYATFEGALTKESIPLKAMFSSSSNQTTQQEVGVIIEITPVGAEPRMVFCPEGQLADICREIPLSARVAVSGKPMGSFSILPDTVKWRSE